MARNDNPLASITLLLGEEELLVERAIAKIAAAARERDPDTDVQQLAPDAIGAGEFASLSQPSLFGGERVIVVRSAQELGKDAAGDLIAYLSAPAAEVTLVLAHAGGKKGQRLLDAAKKANARTVSCAKLTKYRERVDFVRAEVHGAGRVIDDAAARSLIDAVGSDLRELANACSQLVADTAGDIGEDEVARYHQGKAEVSGFTVADCAVEGRTADALEQLRWALQTDVHPVLITSALAQGLRAIAKVGGAPRGASGQSLARQVGMPPWKVDRVRQQLRGWTPEGISYALRAVAETDAQVKGGAADAEYALERAVLTITAARGR